MAGGFKVRQRLTGAKEVEARLQGLKDSVRNKVLRPGVTKAARMVAKAVKAAAPVGPTGATKKALSSKVITSRKRGVIGLVGARTGFAVTDAFGYKHDPSRVLHIEERGRKAVAAKPGKSLALRGVQVARAGRGRGRTKTGVAWRKSVGPAAGKRFLASTWSATKGQAAALVWSEVAARIKAKAA